MPWTQRPPWVLIRSLRAIMASASEPQAKLDSIVKVIASNMIAEVSSIYVRLPDESLELFATEGLKKEAVHALRMNKGEGLVGLIADWGQPINLPDAQKHPSFSYKPETGEENYHSFLGVPIVRERRTIGVLTVQNKIERRYTTEEVEALETTAMVLAELIGSGAFAGAVSHAPGRRETSVTLKGTPLADGLALGHIALHEPRPVVLKFFADNIPAELKRLEDALERLKDDIRRHLEHEDSPQDSEHQAVLEAVQMLANDKGWARRMRDAVMAGLTAEAAVERVQQNMRTQLMKVGDDFWRERSHDIDDLSTRLLRTLQGQETHVERLPNDAILVARNMGAAELLSYDPRKLRGLVIEEGGATSHVSIVARSFNLAVLVQVPDVLAIADHGDPAILDAATGQFHVRPSLELIRAYADKARFRARRQARFSKLRHVQAITKDGERVLLNMNAGLTVDLPHLYQSGADGIGLYRTELQFMVASRFPKMEEQRKTYNRILDMAASRRVVFRSLDVGGDKVLPYLRRVKEENPALGWRAIRMSLDRPALFRTQARALMRAAAGRELSLMLPFIADVSELLGAKALIDKEVEHAKRHGHELPSEMRIGVMVEIPAILYQLDQILPLVDFISVGSNDLLQFLFAADRENERVARRFDPLHPSALKVLREIATKAIAHKTDFALCGEMAGRPVDAMALIGLGFRSISMAPASVGPIKAMVLSLDTQKLAETLNGLVEGNCPTIRRELTEFARKENIDI
ncbi:phosphoenolpyruvate--protein phosphotransferase [Rhodomicrobium lacus]|uniref:phosphoenolpyruvate--protein phosphotransferase n=1 Tax=Rhodomicrobium lacus TaxID=2498452 RepID=UPI0026E31588|nr:phosphoenolpyruvate--protein phosphotransferase [Rhodomicrobium lacus]WKW49624.1 phosphoenolpyruvate--protein phosphotransferase [Rhodomicrobium lacus]